MGFYIALQGLMARVYETFIVLCLLAVVVLGMTYVMSALIDKEQSSILTLLSKLSKTFQIIAFYFVLNLFCVYYNLCFLCCRSLDLLFTILVFMHLISWCAYAVM
jgi:hypothetical protein